MMKLLPLVFLLVASSVSAQTVIGTAFRLNTGPCLIRSGSGSPEGAVTGVVCDTWYQTDTPYNIWRKTSGTGTTGWVVFTNGLLGAIGGSGTSGNLTQWTAGNVLTNGPAVSNVPLLNAANVFTAAQSITVATGAGILTKTASTGTNPVYDITQNTGGRMFIGISPSTANFWSTGSGAYYGVLWMEGNRGIDFGTNNLIRATLHPSGGFSLGGTTDPGALNLSVAGTLTISDAAGNAGAIVRHLGSSTTRNFQVGNQVLLSNAYTITPSTANGGSTFTTPAMAVHGSGGVSFGDLGDPGLKNISLAGNAHPVTGYFSNLGTLQKKYLTLHAAELWVETLVAQNTIATIGGRVLVGPTTSLVLDISTTDGGVIVKHNQMVVGERVYMEADGKVEFFAITSGPVAGETCTVVGGTGPVGSFCYGVTRNLDASGANLWYAGDAVFNTGATGNGFIDLYSVRGVRAGTEVGPTIAGNVRNSATYNDWTPRWAIGNLDGLYGYSGSVYGAAFGVPTAAWLKIDPTNGIRIGHNTTTYTQIDAAGNASFTGTVTAGAGAIGGWSIGADYIRDVANATGMASTVTGGDDVRFWAGNTFANRATAPFRVTEAGVFTATSGTITGQLYGKASSAASPALSFTEDTDSGIYWTVSPPSIGFAINGVEQFNITTDTLTASLKTISLGFRALGTGAQTGKTMIIGGNSSGSGAAGTLSLGMVDGNLRHLWIDAAGALRLGTARPEEDGTPSDTSGVIIGSSAGNYSGTYTPTLTGVANVAAATAYACQYVRVAGAVTVSCYFEVDPTATTTRTQLGISLPIASAFTNLLQGTGAGGAVGSSAAQGGAIYADATNDRVTYDYYSSSAADTGHTVTFTYQVL